MITMKYLLFLILPLLNYVNIYAEDQFQEFQVKCKEIFDFTKAHDRWIRASHEPLCLPSMQLHLCLQPQLIKLFTGLYGENHEN